MSGGSSKQTSNQTTSTQLPEWVTAAGQQNYNTAQNIASTPDPYYQGPTTAALAGNQTQAANLAGSNAGTIGTGINSVLGQIQGNNLSSFMNPYTSSVVDTSEKALQQSLDQSQTNNAAMATGANAFGGSRAGVQAGVTAAQGAQAAGQLAANLNQANYSQAQSAAAQNYGLQLNSLGQLQNANSNDISQLMNTGAVQQANAQQALTGQIGQYNQQAQYPQQMLGLLQQSLATTPYNTTTTSNGTTTKSSSPDWATSGLGLLKLGASFF